MASDLNGNRLDVSNWNADNPVIAVLDPSLFDRHAVDIHLFDQFWQHGQNAVLDFMTHLHDSWDWVVEFGLAAFCLALIAGFLAGTVFFALSRRLTRYLSQEGISHPRLVTFCLALTNTLVPATAFFLAVIVTRFFFHYSHIASPPLIAVYDSIMAGSVMVMLAFTASKTLLYPHFDGEALLDILPKTARHLVAGMVICVLLVYGTDVVDNVLDIIDARSSLIAAWHLVTIVAVGLVAFFLLPKAQQLRVVRSLSVLIVGLALLFALAGYIHLGHFIVKFSVIAAVFLPLVIIGLMVTHLLMCEGTFAATRLGQFLTQHFALTSIRLDQIGLVLGLFFGFLLLVITIAAIFLLCGFSGSAIGSGLLHLLAGVQIGSVFISPFSLFVGFVFFLASLFLCRWLVKMFDGVVLTHGHIDVGLRHSIRTFSGYASLALAGIIGISAAGFNLSSLAIIAGGLSLGIGFGMQNIVQNFVSGLILLAARPFKVGDFVEIGSVTGSVRQISFRATEIETLERRSVIIPNSAFINSNVSNWTPHDLSGQIALSFTLPARDAPDDMLGQLLELLRQTPKVLPSPPPEGELTSFSNKDFTFSLYAHIADIRAIHKVKTTLNLAVYKKFFHQEEQGE